MVRDGIYNQLLNDYPNNAYSRLYFRCAVLDHFIQSPNYSVSSCSIHPRVDDQFGGIQQYIPALDKENDYCIMVLLRHLCQLHPDEQDIFYAHRIDYGSISIFQHRIIVHGEPQYKIRNEPYITVITLIKEINNIVKPKRLYRRDQNLFESKEFLPLRFNSKKAYINFVASLDNLVNHNIDNKFFPKNINSIDKNGNKLGSINLLENYLRSCNIEAKRIRQIINPLRNVRYTRNEIKGIRVDDSNKNYYKEQEKILFSTVYALRKLTRELGRLHLGDKYKLKKIYSAKLLSIYDPINYPEYECDNPCCKEIFAK